jgi:hypothetical protein
MANLASVWGMPGINCGIPGQAPISQVSAYVSDFYRLVQIAASVQVFQFLSWGGGGAPMLAEIMSYSSHWHQAVRIVDHQCSVVQFVSTSCTF